MAFSEKNILSGVEVINKKVEQETIAPPNELLSSLRKPLTEEKRREAIQLIEEKVLDVVRQLAEGKDPELLIPRGILLDSASSSTTNGSSISNKSRAADSGASEDVDASGGRGGGAGEGGGGGRPTKVRFGAQASRRKFSVLVMLLSRTHKLLSNRTTCTRRQVYYEQVSWLKSQREVDDNAVAVSRLIGLPPWHLGLLATAKGLAAGDLKFTTMDGEVVDCRSRPGGVLVPGDVASIDTIESNARYILLLEKDTIFQRILNEGATERLGPCVIITAKGYPDMSTRVLLARLEAELKIPILAVMDADPHGVHIMSVYRFGTKNFPMPLRSLRWLGVFPSELGSLGLRGVPLTANDVALGRRLLEKPYVLTHPELKRQIEVMLSGCGKAEVDALTEFSSCYLTDVYLPNKIAAANVI